MIYRTSQEIIALKPGTKIWACAYEFDNNKTTMGLISKPIYGMTKGYGWDYKDNYVDEEESYPSYFVPFRKGSETEFVKSKAVQVESRVYADTYDECKELYNQLISERIEWFNKRIEETKSDMLA